MKICIQLAKKGLGKTSPNPLVGCVILNEKGEEISRGYHSQYGANHAERDALLKVKKGDAHTLIVNLEPCSHYGKTPPCTDLIIEYGVKKVVIGMRDVNPKVSGIEKLKAANIEVIEDVLNNECLELNEVFIKNMTQHIPFVAIKTATTLDGKIATKNGSSKWITSSKAREKVKVIRDMYDAIMTSSSTIIADNPSMVHPKKIILDRLLRTDKNSKIYQTGKCLVFYDESLNPPQFTENIEYIPTPVMDDKLNLDFIFKKLYQLGIMSVIVECGGRLNGDVLKHADKIYHFIAPKIAGDNTAISCFDFRNISNISECDDFIIKHIETYEQDIMLVYYPAGK